VQIETYEEWKQKTNHPYSTENSSSTPARKYAGRGRDTREGEKDSTETPLHEETGLRDDAQDGSKYIGQMARDSGQFGSFPGHDDYGEEADP
jgi:hypothetical protein